MKERADVLAVEQGLAESRAKAQAAIMAGLLLGPHGNRIDKPGTRLDKDQKLQLRGQASKYVSRGGLKLEAALREFAISPQNAACLDIGSSTGGFTDCLLQHGAQNVYAVDVGYGELAWSLRNDPRVILMERNNIRHLPKSAIPEPCEVVTIDVSFISLELVLPVCQKFMAPSATVVALVKPQFEVGKDRVGKGGIVRDPSHRQAAVDKITRIGESLGYRIVGTIPSPITGAKGNQEYLLAMER